MMNEKFMELADQLKRESDVSYGELMRFAALIVKECAEVVDNDDSSYPYDSFGHKLKQHFGMK